jgi:hypothetical protein
MKKIRKKELFALERPLAGRGIELSGFSGQERSCVPEVAAILLRSGYLASSSSTGPF